MRYFWCELAIVSAFMITFAVEFNSLTIINIRTMVNYKDLGLVNTRDMFAKAIKGGYAIPAFNFNNMEQMQAIIKAAVETKSPVILQVSKGARQYANATLLRYMAQGAVEYAKELGCAHPEIVLHLDHGDTFETCKSCIDSGFSSVMIDGSHLPYEEKEELSGVCESYGIDLISLIAPTSHERIRMIAKEAKGFVYCVSSLGVTGVRSEIKTDVAKMVEMVKEVNDIPAAIGFGISTPEQAKKMASVSDGAIVGSAIVKIVAKYGKECIPEVEKYVKERKAAVET